MANSPKARCQKLGSTAGRKPSSLCSSTQHMDPAISFYECTPPAHATSTPHACMRLYESCPLNTRTSTWAMGLPLLVHSTRPNPFWYSSNPPERIWGGWEKERKYYYGSISHCANEIALLDTTYRDIQSAWMITYNYEFTEPIRLLSWLYVLCLLAFLNIHGNSARCLGDLLHLWYSYSPVL